MNAYELLNDWKLGEVFSDVVLDEVEDTKKYILEQRVQVKNEYWSRTVS